METAYVPILALRLYVAHVWSWRWMLAAGGKRTLNCYGGFPEHVGVFQQLRLVSVDGDDPAAPAEDSAVAQPEVTHSACRPTKQNLGVLQIILTTQFNLSLFQDQDEQTGPHVISFNSGEVIYSSKYQNCNNYCKYLQNVSSIYSSWRSSWLM